MFIIFFTFLQILTIAFLYVHLYLYLKKRYLYKKKQQPLKLITSKQAYSIVIPASNEENNIERLLIQIKAQKGINLNEIILVINNSTDKTFEIAKKIQKDYSILRILEEKNAKGKSNALLKGLKETHNPYVFIIDADTNIFPNSLSKLSKYQTDEKSKFTIGLIRYKKKNNFQSKIIEYERYFINDFIQTARSVEGVSTLHGSFALVEKKSLIKSLTDNVLQDDLMATYKIIANGDSINLVNDIVAEEDDRDSFKYLVFQRVRWVTGNILLIPLLIRSTSKTKFYLKKFLLMSYPFLWYIIYYILVLGYILSNQSQILLYLGLIVHLSYFSFLYIASKNSGDTKILRIVISIMHSLIFPLLITLSTIIALIFFVMRIRTTQNIFFKRT